MNLELKLGKMAKRAGKKSAPPKRKKKRRARVVMVELTLKALAETAIRLARRDPAWLARQNSLFKETL